MVLAAVCGIVLPEAPWSCQILKYANGVWIGYGFRTSKNPVGFGKPNLGALKPNHYPQGPWGSLGSPRGRGVWNPHACYGYVWGVRAAAYKGQNPKCLKFKALQLGPGPNVPVPRPQDL